MLSVSPGAGSGAYALGGAPATGLVTPAILRSDASPSVGLPALLFRIPDSQYSTARYRDPSVHNPCGTLQYLCLASLEIQTGTSVRLYEDQAMTEITRVGVAVNGAIQEKAA